MSIPMSEPVPIADIFCERVGRVELIDGVVRITFCVTQFYEGERERAIVCRVVMPEEAVPQEWLSLAVAAPESGGIMRDTMVRH